MVIQPSVRLFARVPVVGVGGAVGAVGGGREWSPFALGATCIVVVADAGGLVLVGSVFGWVCEIERVRRARLWIERS